MSRVRVVGERALLLAAEHPAAVASWLRAQVARQGVDVVDVVPAARTVLVSVSGQAQLHALRDVLDRIPEDLPDPARDGRLVRVPVRFDGPDLAAVAERAHLAPDGVVRRLAAAEFVVRFCGFAPGFAYLAGLPPELRGPRRAEPRTRVPAGSLALADEYAAVYPRDSPGGWQLVGSTELDVFDVDRDPPALLTAGTRVRFEALP